MGLGEPFFQGNSDQDQIIEIYNVIGDAGKADTSEKEKKIKGKGWNNVILR